VLQCCSSLVHHIWCFGMQAMYQIDGHCPLTADEAETFALPLSYGLAVSLAEMVLFLGAKHGDLKEVAFVKCRGQSWLSDFRKAWDTIGLDAGLVRSSTAGIRFSASLGYQTKSRCGSAPSPCYLSFCTGFQHRRSSIGAFHLVPDMAERVTGSSFLAVLASSPLWVSEHQICCMVLWGTLIPSHSGCKLYTRSLFHGRLP